MTDLDDRQGSPPTGPGFAPGAESSASGDGVRPPWWRLDRGLLIALGLFVVSLVLPPIGALIGVGSIWLWVVLGAGVGTFSLTAFNLRFRRRLSVGLGDPAAWLRWALPQAGVAIAVVAAGSLLIAAGTQLHRGSMVAVGLGALLGGLVVVARVVAVEANRQPGRSARLSRPLVIGINTALVVVATLMPAVAFTRSPWAIVLCGAGAIPWLIGLWVGRSGSWPWWTPIGFCLLASPLAVLLFVVDRDRRIPPLVVGLCVLALVLGLAILAARQRSSRGAKSKTIESVDEGFLLAAMAVAGAFYGSVLLVIHTGGPGVPWPVVAAGAAAGLVAGASLVIRGEGLLVVAVVGMVLVWSVVDHATEVEVIPVGAGEGNPVLLAFGDSYMSGEGTGRFYEGTNFAGGPDYRLGQRNDCRRSPDAYAPVLADELGFELWFDACSGAKAISDELAAITIAADEPFSLDQIETTSFLDDARAAREHEKNTIVGQLLRWRDRPEADRADPDVVLVSLGGNDAGFGVIGQSCFLPGSCRAALEGREDAGLDGVTARAGIALTAVAQTFPDAIVAVVAYPQMFAEPTPACAGQIPFDRDEVLALAGVVESLNDAVGRAVDQAATVTDRGRIRLRHLDQVEAAFEGRRFCELDSDGRPVDGGVVNPFYLQAFDSADLFSRFGSKLVNNTFHPTVKGHELLTAALRDDLAQLRRTSPVVAASVAASPACVGPDCAAAGPPAPTIDAETPEPAGVCGDLDSYVYCSLVASTKEAALPVLFLVIGGAAGARRLQTSMRVRRWLHSLLARFGLE